MPKNAGDRWIIGALVLIAFFRGLCHGQRAVCVASKLLD